MLGPPCMSGHTCLSNTLGRAKRHTISSQYDLEKAPSSPPPPPPPPPPKSGFRLADRRALLISVGALGFGVAVANKLMPSDKARNRRGRGKDDPWKEPLTEGMQSDVVEDDGEIAVRMSTGNWYILRQDPGDGRAFILEGGFGDRYRLQTDKPVRSFSMKMLQRIFARHDLWERRLVRLQ